MKNHMFFIWYKKTPIILGWTPTETILAIKVDRYLSMLESSQPEPIIEEEKLKSFVSNISVSESTYRAYSVNEKTEMLTKYYSELYKKYYGAGNFLFFLFPCLLLGAVFCLCLIAAAVLVSVFFFLAFLVKKKLFLFRFIFNFNW